MPVDSSLRAKLDALNEARLAKAERNREILESWGVLGTLEKLKAAFGEGVRPEAVISPLPPYFLGDREYCRKWWKKHYGGNDNDGG